MTEGKFKAMITAACKEFEISHMPRLVKESGYRTHAIHAGNRFIYYDLVGKSDVLVVDQTAWGIAVTGPYKNKATVRLKIGRFLVVRHFKSRNPMKTNYRNRDDLLVFSDWLVENGKANWASVLRIPKKSRPQ